MLGALLSRIRGRIKRVLREMPPVPQAKALLSRDGGICARDGTPLRFDPWSPSAHVCPGCATSYQGERHGRHWARAQHLWLAERAADLATVAVLTDDAAAAERAGEILSAQAAVYQQLPNQDNVLGPTHLFFSTYLESMWITNWLASAFLLREAGLLADERVEAIDQVAEEAASLIGDFNEHLSNRQVWNAAALTAIAAWFADDELAQTAIEARTGLLGLLADGFEGREGLWWEGENYHLFALRGLMIGLRWGRTAGIDLLEDPELGQHFALALMAPSITALPDLTFPARKDSRYGVSLAQPAYLELWEVGRAWAPQVPGTGDWLERLYRLPAPEPDHYDAWLHDAGLPTPERRSAADLSWWTLFELDPDQPVQGALEVPSTLIESQGLGVLRQADTYVSLECGAAGGGHRHPDRLHLTLHARGVHWLPDPGTGSYVDRTLFWYRSVRAHNAPAVDGESPAEARVEAFDAKGDWGWVKGRAGQVTRTVASGPGLVLDLVELEAREARHLELPWHLQGEARVLTPGKWEAADLSDEAVADPERFVPEAAGPVVIESTAGSASIRLHLVGPAELIRATGPGLPRHRQPAAFFLQRIEGPEARLIALLELEPVEGTTIQVQPDSILVQPSGIRFTRGPAGLQVATGGGTVSLGGSRPSGPPPKPLLDERPRWDAVAVALPCYSRPALDGSLEGFDTDQPITLEDEHQYRRSEEPYDPERIAADAWINWDLDGVYLGVHVRKPELIIPEPGAPPLELDNEEDDIHRDGIQFYLRWSDGTVTSWLVAPEPDGSVRARPIAPAGESAVTGAWAATDAGYLLTVGLTDPNIIALRAGERLGFDLLINEMTSDRVRRLGQLVWSGGNGWVYLRGDRQEPSHFGMLDLR